MEQNAYNRWAAERDNKYNLLGIAQGLEQQEYDRAQDEENTAYTRAWNEDAREYEQEANSRSELLAKAQVLASYGNFSGYKALGYTDEEIASMQQAYKQQADADAAMQSAELAKIYAGIGGDDEVYEPTISLKDALELYKEGTTSSNVMDALRHYLGDDYFEYSQEELNGARGSQQGHVLSGIIESKGNDAAYNTLLEWVNEGLDKEFANKLAAALGIEEPEA